MLVWRQREAILILHWVLKSHTCAGASTVIQYLLDVAFNVEWQVEEKLETLQDIECIACGVSFVFPTQDLLEKSIRCITRSCEKDGERQRVSERERGRRK